MFNMGICVEIKLIGKLIVIISKVVKMKFEDF